MKTYYIIRSGWNSANQSARWTAANPKNDFDSGRYALVAIVTAESEDDAKESYTGTVYNNQHLIAETNPRAIKGLAQAIREFYS